MVRPSISTPAVWEDARRRHETDTSQLAARVYARRWKAATAAAATAHQSDTEIRHCGNGDMTCSNVCTALLIQEVLSPGDTVQAGILSRMLSKDSIDLGHVRMIRCTSAPKYSHRCVVDGTVIESDGPHYETASPLWTEANDHVEAMFLEDAPIAYFNPRTGSVLLRGEVEPLFVSAFELHELLRTPTGQRSAFLAGLHVHDPKKV